MLPPALHHPRYRRYWSGLILAWAGNQILIWSALWHIRSLTDQPLALGLVGLIRVAPILAFSLPSGPVADAFNRRKLLILTQGVFALSAFSVGTLTLSGRANLGLIYALFGLHAITQAFDQPAREALIAGLVPAKDLHNAFSLRIFGLQIGSLIGPPVSGLLIDQLGQSAPYAASGLAFLAFAAVLFSLGPVSQRLSGYSRRPVSRETVAQGLRFTLGNPLILSSMLLDFLATALTRADNLMPIIARDVLGVGPLAYGWLSAAQAIGATTAGVILTQIRVLRRQGLILYVAVGAVGVGTLVFGLSRSLGLSMAALILVGASDAVSSVIRNTLRQMQTPDQLRGRMVSVNQIFFMGGPQVGEVRAGILGQLAGVPLAIASGGVACLAALAWVAGRWPQLRRYQGSETSPAQAD